MEGGAGENALFNDNDKDEAVEEEPKQVSVDLSIYSLTFASMITQANVKFDLSEHVEDYFFKATMIFFI